MNLLNESGEVQESLHMFWYCEKLKGFWNAIHLFTKSVLAIEFALSPCAYLLNDLPELRMDQIQTVNYDNIFRKEMYSPILETGASAHPGNVSRTNNTISPTGEVDS